MSNTPAKRIGRKSKLTPELQKNILRLIEMGVPQKHAALACGIHECTVSTWKARGEKGIEPYANFLKAMKEADSRAMARYVELVAKAACIDKQWAAAMTMLERRWKDHFGRKENLTITDDQRVNALEAENERLLKKLKDKDSREAYMFLARTLRDEGDGEKPN